MRDGGGGGTDFTLGRLERGGEDRVMEMVHCQHQQLNSSLTSSNGSSKHDYPRVNLKFL